MAKYTRKKNLIDGKVQGGLVVRIMCHWLFFFGVTAFLFVVMQTMGGDPATTLSERLAGAVSEYALLALVIFAVLPAFVLDTIRFSNRFVGPVFRLRRALRELGEHGTTDTVQFRDNDFWQEIAGDLNKVIARVRIANATSPAVRESSPTS
jgi:hypothetical protein